MPSHGPEAPKGGSRVAAEGCSQRNVSASLGGSFRPQGGLIGPGTAAVGVSSETWDPLFSTGWSLAVLAPILGPARGQLRLWGSPGAGVRSSEPPWGAGMCPCVYTCVPDHPLPALSHCPEAPKSAGEHPAPDSAPSTQFEPQSINRVLME